MTRQSRRTQRALERALFGPEPRVARRAKPREPKPEIVRQYMHRPGDCPMCGNVCEPGGRWTCPWCRVLYANRERDRFALPL